MQGKTGSKDGVKTMPGTAGSKGNKSETGMYPHSLPGGSTMVGKDRRRQIIGRGGAGQETMMKRSS